MEIIEKRAAAKGVTVEQAEHDLVQDIPVRRMATPEEVAAAIVWLASEPAASITGQTLLVDGGSYRGL
jgi:3-oxoacyl-[acyl-carrier protein] reductase